MTNRRFIRFFLVVALTCAAMATTPLAQSAGRPSTPLGVTTLSLSQGQKPAPPKPTAPSAATAKPQAATATATGIPRLTFEKYTLPNGLDVILRQDKRLPLVAVDLWYHVGPSNEE